MKIIGNVDHLDVTVDSNGEVKISHTPLSLNPSNVTTQTLTMSEGQWAKLSEVITDMLKMKDKRGW
jgi:hypothetical protein